LQAGAATRQCAVTVTGSGAGPHDASPVGLVVRLTFVGLLTEVWNTTSVTFGAHFTSSPTLPEPALPENVIVTGFADQSVLGAVTEAKLTAAYAPTISRLIERPTIKCGRYRLIGDDNCKLVGDA